MNKLVSVIITTYGRNENLILEAIESVRNQTYENIEIIVVDDNGLNTEMQKKNSETFKQMSDIRYIPNRVNSGAQFSRNMGIMAAKGAYIACLDDDDIWMPQKIQKQVDFLEKNDLDMVFCNGYRFYNNNFDDKKLYQVNFIEGNNVDYITELRADRIGSTSHPLFKKEFLAKTGIFDIDMPARQDYEMWLRMCKYGNVQGLNEPLFYYRYHDGVRITKSYNKELRSYQLLWQKYRNDYEKDREAKSNIMFILAVTYFKMKKYTKAGMYGISAVVSSPKNICNILKKHMRKQAQF